MKGFLENRGVSSLYIHDITKLIRMSKNNGSAAQITEWVDSHSDTLTHWEVDTRYNYDFCSSLSTVREAIIEIRRFLELNGLTDRLRPELQVQATKDKLLRILPKRYRTNDEFSLNCYYQIFQKQLKDVTGDTTRLENSDIF